MKLKRVEHVAIAVHDMQASMKMLEETLGLELDYEERIGDTRLAMYPVGETSIELLQAEGPASQVNEWIEGKGESLYHLCFEVDDIDAALAELKGKGVKLIDETPATAAAASPSSTPRPPATSSSNSRNCRRGIRAVSPRIGRGTRPDIVAPAGEPGPSRIAPTSRGWTPRPSGVTGGSKRSGLALTSLTFVQPVDIEGGLSDKLLILLD